MEKVVVTGSTGFIGRHLVTGLKSAGFEVIETGRDFSPVECDRVYHMACPGKTHIIDSTPLYVMDVIMDMTRQAMLICPSAKFINASSMGIYDLVDTQQGAYNIAKRCMEMYLRHSKLDVMNYRIPSVYGEGMADDAFIKRCADNNAYYPPEPDKVYWIAHVSEVVDALVTLRPINIETTTLGKIYELFNSGRRGLHRPTPDSGSL